MRFGIISDIHGNAIALEAVLHSIKQSNVDRIVCLGDLVGYGAQPNQVITILQDWRIPCILGNHDFAALQRGSMDNYNVYAKHAINWTREHLSAKSRKFLESLEYSLDSEGYLFVHASPEYPPSWDYVHSQEQADKMLDTLSHPICFFGHTHIPIIYSGKHNEHRLINVGSVGQPRDRDPRSCWGLFDTDTSDVQFIRVSYPVNEAADLIIRAGLPVFLAKRLYHGK